MPPFPTWPRKLSRKGSQQMEVLTCLHYLWNTIICQRKFLHYAPKIWTLSGVYDWWNDPWPWTTQHYWIPPAKPFTCIFAALQLKILGETYLNSNFEKSIKVQTPTSIRCFFLRTGILWPSCLLTALFTVETETLTEHQSNLYFLGLLVQVVSSPLHSAMTSTDISSN